jgi:hypothetical protein
MNLDFNRLSAGAAGIYPEKSVLQLRQAFLIFNTDNQYFISIPFDPPGFAERQHHAKQIKCTQQQDPGPA